MQKEKLRKKEAHISSSNNFIADIIKFIAGTIFGIGSIAGIIISEQNEETFLLVLLEIWGICGITTILLLALAEIIQILHDIRAKIYRK